MSQVKNQMDDFTSTIKNMDQKFKEALPEQIPSDRFRRFLLIYVTSNPKLLAADRNSLYKAALQCAQAGLMPDGREAALVVYRSKNGGSTVSFLPMVAGIIKLAYNTGKISTISAGLVFEGDQFDYWIDEAGEHLIYRPKFKNRQDANITHCFVQMKNTKGHTAIELMTIDEIMEIRERSRAKDDGPWRTDFAEMCKKTVIKRAAKRWPSTPELQRAIDADNDIYDVSGDSGPAALEAPKRPRKSRLSKIVEEAAQNHAAATPASSMPEMIDEHEPSEMAFDRGG